jgi:hypothetical protein
MRLQLAKSACDAMAIEFGKLDDAMRESMKRNSRDR